MICTLTKTRSTALTRSVHSPVEDRWPRAEGSHSSTSSTTRSVKAGCEKFFSRQTSPYIINALDLSLSDVCRAPATSKAVTWPKSQRVCGDSILSSWVMPTKCQCTEVINDLQQGKYQMAEYRISIYGRRASFSLRRLAGTGLSGSSQKYRRVGQACQVDRQERALLGQRSVAHPDPSLVRRLQEERWRAVIRGSRSQCVKFLSDDSRT